ncbi:hypothetical protein Btru_058043 [Bulinus truncatus]|nr:hypothetical protein Btru_058043 [Bulinus truncatus]
MHKDNKTADLIIKKYGYDVMSENIKDELFKAIRLKNKELLKDLLLNKSVHPDSRHARDFTPAVVFAVKYKNHFALRLLLKCKSNPNAVDKDGLNALLYASDKGCLEYLKDLKKFNADFNVSDVRGATALMLCAQWGHDDCLQFLLNEHPDVNIKDKNGETALIYASKQGRTTCVQHLMNSKANKNSVCLKRYSALMHALKNSEFETAELLLNKGAEVNIVGADGKTALTLAFQNCLGNYTLVENILKRDAELNLSKRDQDYLHEMVARGERKVVRMMIINGCSPLDRKCVENCFKFNHHSKPISPLCVALLSGHDDIARYFVINNFLTNYDVTFLSGDPELRNELEDRGTNFVNSLDVLNHLPFNGPYSLYTLCFVKLCNVLSSGDSAPNAVRKEKLSRWKLPKGIQTELLFQGKFSCLCTNTWNSIFLSKYEHQTIETCTCFECENEITGPKGKKLV